MLRNGSVNVSTLGHKTKRNSLLKMYVPSAIPLPSMTFPTSRAKRAGGMTATSTLDLSMPLVSSTSWVARA